MVAMVSYGRLPADLGARLHSAIVVHLHVIKVTVDVVLHVEGGEHEPDDVAGDDGNEPGAVGAVRVTVGVAGTFEGTG